MRIGKIISLSLIKNFHVMQKERVEHIDIAAGIMILWMMIGHCGVPGTLYGQYLHRLLFFFMPWFFYKSGLFFSCSNVAEVANRGGRKLLKSFAIWSIVGYVVYCAVQLIWRTTSLEEALLMYPLRRMLYENLIVCNGPCWFLLTLFFVINIGNILFRRVHPLVVAFFCFVIGYLINLSQNEKIPDLIANTATGLCFFSMGYWMQKKEKNIWIIIATIIGYLVAVLLFRSPFVDMRINQCLIDRTGYDYLLWFPACLCGIVVLNTICDWSMKIYRFPILKFIGVNAMLFYVVHDLPLYVTVNTLENVFQIPADSKFGIAYRTVVCLVTILSICGYLLIKNNIHYAKSK